MVYSMLDKLLWKVNKQAKKEKKNSSGLVKREGLIYYSKIQKTTSELIMAKHKTLKLSMFDLMLVRPNGRTFWVHISECCFLKVDSVWWHKSYRKATDTTDAIIMLIEQNRNKHPYNLKLIYDVMSFPFFNHRTIFRGLFFYNLILRAHVTAVC